MNPLPAPPPRTLAVAAISGLTTLGMMAMGMALPILPPRLHHDLGHSLTLVGWVIGLESLTTLLSRPWTGHVTDRHGGRFATRCGLILMALSGLSYVMSDWLLPLDGDAVSLTFILCGRALMGMGEGLVISGTSLWAMDRAGPDRVGRAVSWVGLGLFAGLSMGSALGAWLDQGQEGGFLRASLVAALIPAAGLTASLFIRTRAPSGVHAAASLGPLLRAVLLPGLGLFANACGFAAVTSFLAIDYAVHDWTLLPFGSPGLGVAGFGAGHIIARLLFSDLSDRVSSRWPALSCLLAEALGLAIIWGAPSPLWALAGAIMTGFGFSMAYPLLTLPLLAAVPSSRRGMAFALFDGFFDSGAGLAALCSGSIAQYLALPSVFLAAALASLAGVIPLLMIPAARWARQRVES